MKPCCADWEPGIEKLNGPIILQSLRAGKDLYTGVPFRFCPWCGAPVQRADVSTQDGENG